MRIRIGNDKTHQKPRVEDLHEILVHFSGTYQESKVISNFISVLPHLGIKHVVKNFFEVVAHDDRSLDGHHQVGQGAAQQAQHSLHPVNLLPETRAAIEGFQE